MMNKNIKYSEPLEGQHFTIAFELCAPRFRNRDQVLIANQSRYDRFKITIQRGFGILQFSSPNIGNIGCLVADDGNKHFFAIVLNDEDLDFYRDGIKMYTVKVTGGMMGTENTITVGSNIDGSSPYYGSIKNIYIYNHSLSQNDILKLMKENVFSAESSRHIGKIPPAPLFEDPLFNSAKDGTVLFNPVEKNWWFIYMQIRNGNNEPGVSVHHGTTIGAASSDDGINWEYRGMLNGLDTRHGENTVWAPEIIRDNGVFHGYFSFVKGIHSEWIGNRTIKHFTSNDLMNWEYVNDLKGIGSCRCLDGCVYPLPTGEWGIWFKDEVYNHTGFARSTDLCTFRQDGCVDPNTPPMEGCDIFHWKNSYWMMGDDFLSYNGLRVYKSDDAVNWSRRENILCEPGKRTLDQNVAHHPEVIINEQTDEAYVFYWVLGDPCTPYSGNENCYLQVAKLEYRNGEIYCDRNKEFELDLGIPTIE